MKRTFRHDFLAVRKTKFACQQILQAILFSAYPNIVPAEPAIQKYTLAFFRNPRINRFQRIIRMEFPSSSNLYLPDETYKRFHSAKTKSTTRKEKKTRSRNEILIVD